MCPFLPLTPTSAVAKNDAFGNPLDVLIMFYIHLYITNTDK
jgi:hypothetical protein